MYSCVEDSIGGGHKFPQWRFMMPLPHCFSSIMSFEEFILCLYENCIDFFNCKKGWVLLGAHFIENFSDL